MLWDDTMGLKSNVCVSVWQLLHEQIHYFSFLCGFSTEIIIKLRNCIKWWLMAAAENTDVHSEGWSSGWGRKAWTVLLFISLHYLWDFSEPTIICQSVAGWWGPNTDSSVLCLTKSQNAAFDSISSTTCSSASKPLSVRQHVVLTATCSAEVCSKASLPAVNTNTHLTNSDIQCREITTKQCEAHWDGSL